MQLILASESKYKKDQLNCLGLRFTCAKPPLDEEYAKLSNKDKPPTALAMFLAQAKAQSMLPPDTEKAKNVIISTDQLVSIDGQILGKSHNLDSAIKQLSFMQGKVHELITALCVWTPTMNYNHLEICRMHMRSLNQNQILNYLNLDMPFDCAGSYKIEKHGMSLFNKIEAEDFSAIQGIPLLALNKILNRACPDLTNFSDKIE